MKRIVCIILAALLTLSLFACAGDGTVSEPSSPAMPSKEESSEESSEESFDESSAEPIAESSEEPIAESSEEPIAESSEEPVEESSEEPVAESSAEPVEESSAEPVEESSAEPVAESSAEPIEESSEEPSEAPPVIVAEKLPQVYIRLPDGETANKSTYTSAMLRIVDDTGVYGDMTDTGAQIKIRGNSTSGGEKKPYNIKFADKKNILGMGKSKKWYLIANHYDKTLIRNKLALDFAIESGLVVTSSSRFVELYINGVYQGCYQLCESIGTGESRVDIDIKNNEFLFEFQPWTGYSQTNSYITPKFHINLGLEDPEEITQEQIEYLDTLFAELEVQIRAKSYTGVSKYLDLESFADDYIVQELFKNVDVGTSSTRFYIKGGKLYAGPAWDFDLSAGNCSSVYYAGYNNVGGSGDSAEGFICRSQWFAALMSTPWFADLVKEKYLALQERIINLTTANSLGAARIDVLVGRYGAAFERNYSDTDFSVDAVYSELERIPDATYEENLEFLRAWIIRRNAWLLNKWGLS